MSVVSFFLLLSIHNSVWLECLMGSICFSDPSPQRGRLLLDSFGRFSYSELLQNLQNLQRAIHYRVQFDIRLFFVQKNSISQIEQTYSITFIRCHMMNSAIILIPYHRSALRQRYSSDPITSLLCHFWCYRGFISDQ